MPLNRGTVIRVGASAHHEDSVSLGCSRVIQMCEDRDKSYQTQPRIERVGLSFPRRTSMAGIWCDADRLMRQPAGDDGEGGSSTTSHTRTHTRRSARSRRPHQLFCFASSSDDKLRLRCVPVGVYNAGRTHCAMHETLETEGKIKRGKGRGGGERERSRPAIVGRLGRSGGLVVYF